MALGVRVVVVTDRSICPIVEILDRLAAILDAAPRGAVRVQVREPQLDGGPLFALVRDILAIARPRGAEVWVNDRADVALAVDADGVHLPERGLAIDDVRALRSGLAVGCSRHSGDGVLAASRAGADVIHLGPIWPTPSKPNAPLGVAALSLPGIRGSLVAVGGIDSPERARDAARAGADAVAVIRAAWTTSDPGATLAALCEAVADR